ncbi:MAG: YggT family protein [Actinomycetota bacterium]|nr:YggT family protein [Actinomycetota bacterium]
MFLVCDALTAYWVILLIRIILSWTTMFWSPPSSLTPAIRVVYDLTEPVMAFFRRFIPPIGGLDLSPIFIFIILQLIRSAICSG